MRDRRTHPQGLGPSRERRDQGRGSGIEGFRGSRISESELGVQRSLGVLKFGVQGGAWESGEGVRKLGSGARHVRVRPVLVVWGGGPGFGVPGRVPAGRRSPRPPPSPALPGPACSCRARSSAGAGGRRAEGGGARAWSPAPRSDPYVTDFEFPDPGTRELGRRLCPPGWPPRPPRQPHTLPARLGLGHFPLSGSPGSLCPVQAPVHSHPWVPCLAHLSSLFGCLFLSLSSVFPQELSLPHLYFLAGPTSSGWDRTPPLQLVGGRDLSRPTRARARSRSEEGRGGLGRVIPGPTAPGFGNGRPPLRLSSRRRRLGQSLVGAGLKAAGSPCESCLVSRQGQVLSY